MPSPRLQNKSLKRFRTAGHGAGRTEDQEWRNRATLLRSDCIVDDSGKRIGLIAVCTDISERKQAEEALRQQTEEQLVVEIAQHIRQSLKLEEILNTTVSEASVSSG